MSHFRPASEAASSVSSLNGPAGPEAVQLPYPGCAAALKCVQEQFCDANAVMVNEPVFLTEEQKIHRTPMMVRHDVTSRNIYSSNISSSNDL